MRETRNQSKISVDQGLSLMCTDITEKPGEVQPERRARLRRGSVQLLAGFLLLLVLAALPGTANAWRGSDHEPRQVDVDDTHG